MGSATGTETASEQDKCARADARRNDRKLVEAAQEVFLANGADASLEEIARRAGVGIGTLYRHFPNRQALIEAVLTDSIRTLAGVGAELLTHPSPMGGLEQWLHKIVEHVTTFNGLAGSMTVAFCKSSVDGPCDAMRSTGVALLQRCQDAGEVRSDVTIDDVVVMMNGLIWTSEHSPTARLETMITVMLDGLRVRS